MRISIKEKEVCQFANNTHGIIEGHISKLLTSHIAFVSISLALSFVLLYTAPLIIACSLSLLISLLYTIAIKLAMRHQKRLMMSNINKQLDKFEVDIMLAEIEREV